MVSTILVCAAALAAGPLADGWQREYSTDAARQPHVIALWQFHAGAELEDSSPNQHRLTLQGAKLTPSGRFGGGLESFPGWPVEDKRHAAIAQAHPSLSPTGAFTIDMWLQPSQELPRSGHCYLLCKKYVSPHDYQLYLAAADGQRRRLVLNLGFGADSELFVSEPADWPVGEWQHLAVSYDGAGTVQFLRNGASFGRRSVPGRTSISPGPLPLSIGDRTGSNYGGFPGILDQIRISRGVREFSPAALWIDLDRTVYVRREPAPQLTVAIRNQQDAPFTAARLRVSGIGGERELELPEIASGATHSIPLQFDTGLRPDTYEVTARLELPDSAAPLVETRTTLTLVPRSASRRMPVMMWGIGSPTEFAREMLRLKELGFTHCLGFGADYAEIWNSQEVRPPASSAGLAATKKMLDQALAQDMGIAAALSPGHFLKQQDALQRVDRAGKPYARRDVNALLPGLEAFCERVGKSVAQAYGSHPAWQAALLNTEVRDDAQVSFSAFDREAYRKFSGQEIPTEVSIRNGVLWRELPGFPADRVIPDDHPILRYYRWYWTAGDGWNALHSALHRGLKSTGRNDLWTWYDPAIRVPSIAGSGGEVEVLGQWTYTEPGPLRVGYFADELFAMASLAPQPQRVMKMTQLFWYRSSSAPRGTGPAAIPSPFDDRDPDAAYITIAPLHLRESFWTKLSRPVAGLMYHGWSALVATDGTHAYKHTQPDTEGEFRRLHRELLPALGPTLLQVPDRPVEVAYLDSFTAQMFARRGSYGYAQDEAYLTLLHAQLQPEVVFEETLLRGGLDRFKVLVLVDCDVLTESLVAKVEAFQRRGGIVIGDPNLVTRLKADITMPRFTRVKKGVEDKRTILANAAALREQLDTRYSRPVECSNPEIISRVRSAGRADYVFVINDQREPGTYVGQHGIVLEHGLPSAGTVRLNRASGNVYDLRDRHPVPIASADNRMTWPVQLGPCEGTLFLVTDRPLTQVAIRAPDRAALGTKVPCSMAVLDPEQQPIDAVIPLHVEILDPHGRAAEYSGYYGASAGQIELELDLATNDVPGIWTIRARELASGLVASHYLRVSR